MAEKGSLRELLEKTEIAFPTEIHHDEAKELLKYISFKVHTSIEMDASIHNRFYYVSPGKKVEEDQCKKSKITCKMRYDQREIDFEFFGPFQDLSLHCGIRFSTPSGYKLSEIPKYQIKLIDKVRKNVKEYFSMREE